MTVHQTRLTIATPGRGTIEITGRVAEAIRASGIVTGIAQVFVRHTSASLLLTENADPDVRHDLETLVQRFAPDGDAAYRHANEGDDDMAAHGRSVLTGSTVSVPVANGRPLLGTWQGIFLWEHRSGPHHRELVITVIA